MKVGIALNMLSQAGRPDVAVINEHMQLGDLAEPLGFDSLFALEHPIAAAKRRVSGAPSTPNNACRWSSRSRIRSSATRARSSAWRG